MKFLKSIFTSMKSHYDKLIAFVIFAVLVGSLIYLAVQLGLIKGNEQAFLTKMAEFKPKFENAETVNTAPFDDARKIIFEPFMLTVGSWSNSPMFRVEQRFWCTSCEKPVPWEALVCPFCANEILKDPEEDPKGDIDNDGLTFEVEEAHGMDPNDPSDAHLDYDNDGFTNYEELTAVPPTNPRDPQDMPPYEQKLKVDALGINPFRLRFKSHIVMPDGSLKFGLNLQKSRGVPSTYFKKIDEDVEGFTLIKYEEKIVEDPVVGKRDLSELTLKRGMREIILIKGQDIQHNEFLVRFYFEPLDLRFIKSPGQEFALKDRSYKVISVDIPNQSVVIMRLSDNTELVIRKLPE